MKGKDSAMLLADLARMLEVELEGDPNVEIVRLSPIDEAEEGSLTFLATPAYRSALSTTRASAVVLAHGEDGRGRAVLRARDPYSTFVRALALFDDRPRPGAGVHPTAVIAESAEIGEGAFVGAFSVIGDHVRIGRDARVHPHVVIYPGVRIGDRFTAHAGAVLREGVVVGDDVVLQPGAVVGGDGFGYVPASPPVPIAQIGTVELGDAVELGANTTVDRATVGATRLGKGVKLDNLVMVGHGSRIGDGSMLAAQTGLAGSTRLGARVLAGGQAGFAGHLEVGDDAKVAARGGVVSDVGAGETVAGMPAVDVALWRRCAAALLRLPEALRRLRRVEARLREIERGRPSAEPAPATSIASERDRR